MRHKQLSRNVPAGDDDGLLSVPGRVVSHDLGVGGDILWGQLGRLVRLSVDPAQRLHFLLGGEVKKCGFYLTLMMLHENLV